MLTGRGPERTRLSDLVEGVRESRGGSLVLRGEPGIGKSELLRWTQTQVPPARCLLAAGVESELELPFATLHQLLYPLLTDLDRLPAVQADALRTAFGWVAGRDVDRFLVAVATLTLLTDYAGEVGLVCLIDDSQWMDSASLDAVEFAARRLEVDGVAVIMTARDGDAGGGIAPSLPTLDVLGLTAEDATALLMTTTPGLADPVVRSLVTASGGNPLALLDLPGQLTPAQRLGEEPLPEPLPVGWAVQRRFASLAARLPQQTRDLLVVVAADDTGRLDLIARAADAVSADLRSLGVAEAAGLVRTAAGRVEFRHPLMRSSVYQDASLATRQSAHRALASVLEDVEDVDRHAWHLAASVTGTNAEIAATLERAALRARVRAGPGPASAALQRAAALTDEPQERGRRLVLAAEAMWTAGRPAGATDLLDRAEPLLGGGAVRAHLRGLRGLVEVSNGAPQSAYGLLLTAAGDADDAHSALPWLALAGEAAWLAGDSGRAVELGHRALELPPGRADADSLVVHLLAGTSAGAAGDWEAACGRLRRVLRSTDRDADPLTLFHGGLAALCLGDESTALALYARAVERIRRTGTIGLLATALDRLAFADALAGRLTEAEVAVTEALRLARELGQQDAAALAVAALVEAWRGNEDSCREHAGQALAQAESRQLGAVAAGATWALGLLDLGMGRPADALERLDPLVSGHGLSHHTIALWAAPDLVEAAARVGQAPAGRAALQRFSAWTQRTGAPWSLGVAQRAAALLAGGDVHRLMEAVAHHDDGRPLDRARTQLCLGEALRRSRRRIEARKELRAAVETFDRLGAGPWAERARSELRASGESVVRPVESLHDRLTPQELQISRLAAHGASNLEIAAQLFVSRKTVEYHLHKVFTKLGITGRLELVKLHLD